MDFDVLLVLIVVLSMVKEIDFFYLVIYGNLGEDGIV